MRSLTLITAAVVAALAVVGKADDMMASSQDGESGSTGESGLSSDMPSSEGTDAGCEAKYFNFGDIKDDQVANLKDYTAQTGPVEVNATIAQFLLSPCSATNLTQGAQGPCKDATDDAFAVHTDSNGTCIAAYTNIKQKAAFTNVTGPAFAVVYETADSTLTLTINVVCEAGATGTTGNVTGSSAAWVLTIASGNVCPETVQAIKPLAPGACSIDFTKRDETFEASLESFENVADKTVKSGNGKMPVAISPCGKASFVDSKGLMNCSDVMGYMAFNSAATGKCVVLDKKMVSYNPNSLEFNSTFSSTPTNTMLLGAEEDDKRQVVVQCGATDSSEGVQVKDTIYYTSKGACGTETQPTAAPKKKDDGLSTGAIVGIVIGVLALIVIILVICRWKSAKTEEEGEYNRV